MFKHSTTKISNEHVNHIVKSILNKKQQTIIEQNKKFIQKNTDENNKRNNYLLEKFTMKKISSPKKRPLIEINNDADDDNDFISMKKIYPKIKPIMKKIDPIKECLESIILQIENNDAICPICNEILSYLYTIDQRQQHVNQCIEQSQINNIETKQQKSLLSYSKFSSNIRKPTTTTTATTSNFKCQICGMSFNVKRSYLTHLKKCSNQNSIQLKHVINFASKTTTTNNEPKPTDPIKKKPEINIKSRVIKMEIPKTEDDEQQQLAIALSASIKSASEPLNAFDILQTATTSKKTKTIDLLTTPLWNVSTEDKLKLSATRLSNICERLITTIPSTDSYKFPSSPLLILSQTNFGTVNWWNITTTDPHDDEIPMTQLARILDNDDDDGEIGI